MWWVVVENDWRDWRGWDSLSVLSNDRNGDCTFKCIKSPYSRCLLHTNHSFTPILLMTPHYLFLHSGNLLSILTYSKSLMSNLINTMQYIVSLNRPRILWKERFFSYPMVYIYQVKCLTPQCIAVHCTDINRRDVGSELSEMSVATVCPAINHTIWSILRSRGCA